MASDGETSCTNDPNFAAIYSFLKVFGKLHGLEPPTIDKLQEFIENTEEVSDALKELHLKLLRRALKSAHSDRWEKCMIKFCHQQGHHQEAWEIERFSYKKASTQVKLKVLKFLLEFQFTCHPKFKTAVNAIPSKELRLDPIGRDKNGCVYWLQVDNDANLCLYKEDQDDETWQLIARNRDELVKVIAQLKSGEEITPSTTCTENEASSEPEYPPEQPPKPEIDEDNEEEFLSPESESEHEDTGTDQNQQASENTPKEPCTVSAVDNNEQITEEIPKEATLESTSEIVQEATEKSIVPSAEVEPQTIVNEYKDSETCPESSPVVNKTSSDDKIDIEDKAKEDTNNENIESKNVSIEDNKDIDIDVKQNEKLSETEYTSIQNNDDNLEVNKQNINENEEHQIQNDQDHKVTDVEINNKNKDLQNDVDVSEEIEDPLMVVTGEGNGVDCDSYFLGEEISEAVMYFYGEGCGYDNDTGNPEAITESNQAKSEDENDEKELVNDSKDLLNGEHETNTTTKISNVKIKSVAKRSLKKQPNDSNDTNIDTKKPCMRDEKSKSPDTTVDLNSETIVNDKNTTDSDCPKNNKETQDSKSPKKNNIKKQRSKVKKKAVVRKIKTNDIDKPINTVLETDNGQDKTSIIEKRKSSVSSVDENLADISKENSDKEDPLATEEPLPPKKLRLESTPESDVNATHSKVVSDAKEALSGKEATSDCGKDIKDSLNDSISKRKKIKARKGKFKKQKSRDFNKNDRVNDKTKKGSKSLKRSLVEAILSDKNKSESQSESDDNEPVTSGKRLKIKPKKILTLSRKKVEAKLQEKHSSDESEEETLYSLAGKKFASKKLIKKKLKSRDSKDPKDKKSKLQSDDSDTPVRQSRRIAQQKIKEEAERRHLEEVALRELKMIHKKKGKDDEDDEEEEEWRASGRGSSSEEENKRKHKKTWRTSDSTSPEPDSDSDSPLFELQPEPEPDLDYDKSDHEFSPESDLETEEPAEPLKRARTLQEEKDDGFCKQCGSGKQPEWILLCDKCDAGYHASCLKPLLFYIPQGDWFCPPCNHEKLIQSLESELVKLDELSVIVEEERARRKLEEPEPAPEKTKEETKNSDDEDSEASSYSSWSSASSGGVYRLRARRQLPVSLRAQEYDRLISAAIKEEYMEPTTSAGNQGRGKDISTIIEAAEEEKMKAERDAVEQGAPIETKKSRKKLRKKPRKLNSLDVPSEDDDEVDEDFKDTGGASSSEDISSSADKDSGDSGSSDSLPIRRTGRSENKKDRPKMTESSPETKKKKKGVFEDSSSESAGAKDWATASKPKSKPSHHHHHHHHRSKDRSKKRDKSKKSRRSRGLTQYDAEGNVIRARVTYGGLSGEEGENDWSPKHRTRQKKINYTEMPNTESEDEMHKSSGKHMPDSSDEFKVTESSDSDWDAEQKKKDDSNAERMKALNDLVKKTAVVPLEKLPEDVTKAKTEELQAHLEAQAANATPRPVRGKGSRGGRGSRGPRGRGGRGGGSTRSGSPQVDDALAKLVGVKVKELGQDGSATKPNQLEREKKRQEREAKLAEKEAKRQERLQKKEEKEKLKEQKAKEREEKKLAKIALQESKRIKKEKEYAGPMVGYGPPPGGMGGEMFQPRPPVPYQDQRFPNAPRLQVRAELRGMLAGDDRGPHSQQQQHNALREGTLSVAGSPQPFKPVSEEPSIITRMPHMINQQYRGPMMYNNSGYGPRGPQNMYQLHPGLGGGPGSQARQYPPQYYRLPPYGPARPERQHQPYRHHMQGPPGPPGSMHHPGPPGSMHHPPGFGYRGPPPNSMPQGHMPDRPGASPNPPSHLGGPTLGHLTGPPNTHGPQNLGPPTTIGGSLAGPNHQTGPHLGPSHLAGPQGHMNQLGRPQGLTNPLGSQNAQEVPNLHGSLNAGSPISHGPLNSLRGPPNSHGGPPNSHGGLPNSHGGQPNSHSGPPNSHSGPRNMLETNPGASQMARGSSPVAGTSGMKHGAPPGVSGNAGSTHSDEPPIKIKAEVKTEPEYRSPPTSPGENIVGANTSAKLEDTPRHPKIKHTENKDRRPRFPLGPYAPHYTPYGPYAPHYTPETHHTLQQYLSAERPRSPAPAEGSPRPYLPPHLRPYGVTRPPPPHHGAVPGLPPHSHHPMPNQNLPPSPGPVNPQPPSPHRTPRPAHPQLPHMPNVPPPSSHPLTHPPPTSHRMQSHHRFPSQPTPLLVRGAIPPQAHSHPPTTLPPLSLQTHHTQPRSPGPRRQSVTPPQNPPLHQPYVQQAQMLQAPLVPSRPTPPPALAQSPSPHNAHMMSQPLLGPRRTPPIHPGRRTPPNLSQNLSPHERASPNNVPYGYAERRPILPQPIPRDSLPVQSPPRREFDLSESQQREFGTPESQRREFVPPESQQREFESPESQRREFESPESHRREFGPPESQGRQFEGPEPLRREFGPPDPQRRGFGPLETQRREFGALETQRREFVPPEAQRREFVPPESQRREFIPPESQRREFVPPESQRREFVPPEPQRREFVPPESQRRDFVPPESQRREFVPPESQRRDFVSPETQRREFGHPESQRRDFVPPESQGREFVPPETQRPEFGPQESLGQGRQFDPEPQPREFEPPESPKESTQQVEADSTIAVKTEPMLSRVKEEPNREEGGVFGGLVSYFSSQHEDDIDA